LGKFVLGPVNKNKSQNQQSLSRPITLSVWSRAFYIYAWTAGSLARPGLNCPER